MLNLEAITNRKRVSTSSPPLIHPCEEHNVLLERWHVVHGVASKYSRLCSGTGRGARYHHISDAITPSNQNLNKLHS